MKNRRIFFIFIMIASLASQPLFAANVIGFDELGRLLDPIDAFYANNPTPGNKTHPPVSPYEAYDHLGKSPIHHAASTCQVDKLKALVPQKSRVDLRDAHGITALFYAVRANCLPGAKWLLQNKANPNFQLSNGSVPLHWAKSNSMKTTLQEAGAKDIPKSTESRKPQSLLLESYEEMQVFRKIVAEDEIRETESLAWSILMGKSTERLKTLIAKGVDVNACDELSNRPLKRAIQVQNAEAITLLLENGADQTNIYCSAYVLKPLCAVVRDGMNDIALSMIKRHGMSIETRCMDNQTPLLLAIYNKNFTLAHSLIKNGANLSAKDDDNQSALHIAIKKNAPLSFIKTLLAANNNVNEPDSQGRTPFSLVRFDKNHRDLFILLLKAGGNVEKRADLIRNIIDSKDKELFYLFIDHGFDVNMKNRDNLSPVELVIYGGDSEMLEALIKKGARVREDVSGKTKDIYLDFRGDQHTGSDDLLYRAVRRGDLDIIKVLLKAGANINAYGNEHRQHYPLHLAVEMKRLDIAEALLKAGSNPNAQDYNQDTPLHYAVAGNQSEMIKLLLRYKAAPDISNRDHKTPLDYAIQDQNTEEIIRLLQKARR